MHALAVHFYNGFIGRRVTVAYASNAHTTPTVAPTDRDCARRAISAICRSRMSQTLISPGDSSLFLV